MLLGALTKRMRSIGLLTRPEPPFLGFSFDELVHNIRAFRWPPVKDCRRNYIKSSNYGCGMADMIKATLTSLDESLCGLDLSDFSAVQDRPG